MSSKLSDRNSKALESRSSTFIPFDSVIEGFGLRVTQDLGFLIELAGGYGYGRPTSGAPELLNATLDRSLDGGVRLAEPSAFAVADQKSPCLPGLGSE